MISRDLYLLIKVYLLSGFFPGVIKKSGFFCVYLRLYPDLCKVFQNSHSVCIPERFFEQVKLFDIFVDDKLKAENKKSVAYTLTFRNKERTLTDNEVNAAMDKLRNKLVADLKFELR